MKVVSLPDKTSDDPGIVDFVVDCISCVSLQLTD